MIEPVQPPAAGMAAARPAPDLPETGQPRLAAEIAFRLRAIGAMQLVRQHRPGSDDAHVAAQDVPELRQLVEAEPPQHPPQRGHARVAFELLPSRPFRRGGGVGCQMLFQPGLGIGHHGAELEHGKRPAATPDARLAKQHPTAPRCKHQTERQQQRRGQHQQRCGDADVKAALGAETRNRPDRREAATRDIVIRLRHEPSACTLRRPSWRQSLNIW